LTKTEKCIFANLNEYELAKYLGYPYFQTDVGDAYIHISNTDIIIFDKEKMIIKLDGNYSIIIDKNQIDAVIKSENIKHSEKILNSYYKGRENGPQLNYTSGQKQTAPDFILIMDNNLKFVELKRPEPQKNPGSYIFLNKPSINSLITNVSLSKIDAIVFVINDIDGYVYSFDPTKISIIKPVDGFHDSYKIHINNFTKTNIPITIFTNIS
jgi:hypothetical protein